MIFDWEKEFNEKTLNEGIKLEDKVNGITEWSNSIHGFVKDKDNSYAVSIKIDDNFKIDSMECDCKKKKCKHMAALISATSFLNNRYLDFDRTFERLDKEKLISFLEDEITYVDECFDDFKEEFREDIIKSASLSHGDELILILEDLDWEDNLLNFLKNNLKELYDEKDYNEAIFLISLMFNDVIERVTFDSNPKVNKCYDLVVEWIIRLSEDIEEIVFKYLTDLLERNYSALYPSFGVLMKFYAENFNDKKYLKIKEELLFK